MKKWTAFFYIIILGTVSITGCAPSAEANVLGYLVAKQFGTLDQSAQLHEQTGMLSGRVVDQDDAPIAGATVIVARRTGEPYVGRTNEGGDYRIEDVPPGKYVPAAVAPGYDETSLHDRIGIPTVIEVVAGLEQDVPLLRLVEHTPLKLPKPLADAVRLEKSGSFEATAPFPEGAAAQVHTFTYQYNGAIVDTLRLYLPVEATEGDSPKELPLFFIVYPTHVDWWQSVSTAFASQGYALVAMSPMATRAVDIDAHAQDALVALTLATSGELNQFIADNNTEPASGDYLTKEGPAVVLGGSFSSAILNRLLRDAEEQVAAWITVGGIGNAFAGTADFYAGRITIPAPYELIIPALGSPRLYPLPFLRYSPVYAAGSLPPTQIIHTAADRIIPIAQARELEQALLDANVPVDVFYYEDVSHYLQIDENLSDAGIEMFYQVLNFVEKHTNE